MMERLTDLASASALVRRYPALTSLRGDLERAFVLLRACLAGGHKILVCGNGGSAADAEHIVGELMKSFAFHRPIPAEHRAQLIAADPEAAPLAAALEVGLPAISLVSAIGLLTAYANDRDYAYAFAQQVYGLGQPGDALIAISTSGNSPSVLNACRAARLRGVAVLGLTGEGGGAMPALCDVVLRAPASQTHLIQELHLPMYHWLCLALEAHFFGANGARC